MLTLTKFMPALSGTPISARKSAGSFGGPALFTCVVGGWNFTPARKSDSSDHQRGVEENVTWRSRLRAEQIQFDLHLRQNPNLVWKWNLNRHPASDDVWRRKRKGAAWSKCGEQKIPDCPGGLNGISLSDEARHRKSFAVEDGHLRHHSGGDSSPPLHPGAETQQTKPKFPPWKKERGGRIRRPGHPPRFNNHRESFFTTGAGTMGSGSSVRQSATCSRIRRATRASPGLRRISSKRELAARARKRETMAAFEIVFSSGIGVRVSRAARGRE